MHQPMTHQATAGANECGKVSSTTTGSMGPDKSESALLHVGLVMTLMSAESSEPELSCR